MTLRDCRRLAQGDFVFHEAAIWRVARPPLVRRRGGFLVRIEAASGIGGAVLEAAPAELRPFGKLRRASVANQLLADHLRASLRRLRPKRS